MKLIIGADHRGHEAAVRLGDALRAAGHDVEVHVPPQGQACDYPETAWIVGHTVVDGRAEMGVLMCGTGVGMCMAANKIKGVRAASVHDELTAEISRSHNNANVICLSADLLGQQLIERIVDQFMRTTFAAGRHARRLEKITMIEEGHDPAGHSSGAAGGR